MRYRKEVCRVVLLSHNKREVLLKVIPSGELLPYEVRMSEGDNLSMHHDFDLKATDMNCDTFKAWQMLLDLIGFKKLL